MSPPHNLVIISLRRANVPENILDMVERYHKDAKNKFITQKFTTLWQSVEKEIITGCTPSLMLLSQTMTMTTNALVSLR